MIVKLLTEHHFEFLGLKGGCRGSSKSTHIKMPHCWKSHALAHYYVVLREYVPTCLAMRKSSNTVATAVFMKLMIIFCKINKDVHYHPKYLTISVISDQTEHSQHLLPMAHNSNLSSGTQ